MSDFTERFDRYFPAVSRAVAYLTSLLVAVPVLYHLMHGSRAYLGFFEDDYFYYATIADKFVTLGKLTYDGTTLTNGFHPLWFIVIVLLRMVCGRFGPAFYSALALISLASMIVTYELGRRFARAMGASAWLASGIAAIYCFATAQLLNNGMECILAVPLFLWLLVEVAQKTPITPPRAAKIGLIASLTILARLDIAIAVALMIAGYLLLVRLPLAELGRNLLAFCLGGLLLPIYAVTNFFYFGSMLPMSALAKRLLTSMGFSIGYARLVAMGTVYGKTMALVLPLGFVALLFLLWRDRAFSAPRFAGALALFFAVTFFGFNALTGWTLFGWYAFPFAPATIAALTFAALCLPSFFKSMPARAIALVIVILVPVPAIRYFMDHGPRWTVSDNTLLAMSDELNEKMKGRDGLFAMGAIAGFSAYVMDKPVFQLEGIVGDRKLLEHVRNQDPLENVLREYHADYLVVSLAGVRTGAVDGCYLITQPNAEWAGPRSDKMRGEICAEPIAHFLTPHGPNPWSSFPSLETYVWDLHTARWKQPDNNVSD